MTIAAAVDFLTRITEPFYVECAFSTEDADGVNLGPMNFFGADLRMQIRETPPSGRKVLELTIANGYIVPMIPQAPGNANLALFMPPAALKMIAVRSYVYDLRYWQGPVLMQGKITFDSVVTR